MTAPADRLREAAGVVRGWVAEAGPQPWAPGAVAAFGPELVASFEAWAFAVDLDPDVVNRTGGLETLAAADSILAAVSR